MTMAIYMYNNDFYLSLHDCYIIYLTCHTLKISFSYKKKYGSILNIRMRKIILSISQNPKPIKQKVINLNTFLKTLTSKKRYKQGHKTGDK